MNPASLLPPLFARWFEEKGWQLRPYQAEMIEAFRQDQSTLLIAPTGGGKTLSGFLPSLIDLAHSAHAGLHTLYISPLKALTNDIGRNLLRPVEEMGLAITIESRTGDTPSHKRIRQRKKPPNLLLTTPESLMLMLSYADAPSLFSTLRLVIIDEAHSFAATKRGDFTALALARLASLSPQHIRFGLSATVAQPHKLAAWLGKTGSPASLVQSQHSVTPDIRFMHSRQRIPFGGFMASYAIADVYQAIKEAGTSLIFVNTRAQAELVFQHLWDANEEGLAIAIYHGSLTKEQRRKTESMMAAGKLRAIVSTSALELGIDWGNVDLVIQMGAPKGVSRLLQRIGRSNHRMDEPSRALLVPSNRFEVLECEAAIQAIHEHKLDGDPFLPGSLDIIPQYMMNCACSAPFYPAQLYQEITSAFPYQHLSWEDFYALLQFAVDGGYALSHYERYHRLEQMEDGTMEVAAPHLIQRHRQNIGVIVEAGRLKVKRLRKAHQGTILGEVEEYFAQTLNPGDTFLFAGEMLAFEAVVDMTLEAWPAVGDRPKIPSYVGGQMPLSTFLADGVRYLLNHPQYWQDVPIEVQEWLELQQRFSIIPPADKLLIEQFPYQKLEYLMIYSFEGRKANQTLGMLLTRRMERAGLKPLSFSITDYGLSICSLHPCDETSIYDLFSPDMLGDDLEAWIMDSPMLKRSFRHVATIAGLTEQHYAGKRKTTKQMTFSTDLIYDVLRKYDPSHILLKVTREDAERELLDMQRLSDLLNRFDGRILFKHLQRVSPMAIPIVLDVRRERVHGSGMEALLEQSLLQDEAEILMEEVRYAVANG